MTFLRATLGLLGLRSASLQSLAKGKRAAPALAAFAAGFLAFVLVRNAVYAGLREPAASGPLDLLLRFGVLPGILYFCLVFIPVLAAATSAFAAGSGGFSASRDELQTLVAVLLPIWGLILLIVAPLQALVPQFLVVGDFAVSVGLALLFCTMTFYTVWVVSEVRRLGIIAAAAAVLVTCLTLPVLYLLNSSGLTVLALLLLVGILSVRLRRSPGGGATADRKPQLHAEE